MKQETKLIREILKAAYPGEKFRLEYRHSINYFNSRSMMIVTCNGAVDTDDVVSLMKMHTSGVEIKQSGAYKASQEKGEAKIKDVLGNWIDAGALEVIRIVKGKQYKA